MPPGHASTGSLSVPLVSPAMEDLAQVTVYALYLWLAASLLWMWRSVLRNRRARKLTAEQARFDGRPRETTTDQDEMMSTISPETASTSSNSTTGSDVDLRSDSAATDDSVSAGDSATQGSLEKANAKLAMATPAKQSNTGAPPTSLPKEPADSSKPAEKLPKEAAGQANSRQPTSTRPKEAHTNAQPDQPSTIADYLGGIRLPYDLLPMVPNGEKASDQRVSLVSDGAQPEVVGAAIADELERLGYSIKTLSTDEAVAVRDKQTLGLQIYPDASELSNEAGLRFPEAVAGSVAIDLWVKG